MKKFLFFLLLTIAVFSISALASDKVSPAVDVIANENSMVKAGVVFNGEINFDVDDFDDCVGSNVKSIKICSLPSEKAGKLMLDNLYVVENQVIERESFASLRFIPRSNEQNECVFKFIPKGASYELECSIKITSEVNYSPVSANGTAISTWTGRDVSCFGVLEGSDPEGDNLKFEIVSYPKKGLVQLVNSETGDYKYTPYSSARGTDSFTYRVCDSYGNYSAETKVSIKIARLKTTLVFSDMTDNKALNAAYCVGNVYMQCEKSNDGSYLFNPEKTVTTEEFLALVMNVMGAKDIPSITTTRFADDNQIDPKYKGYFESAFSLGIIEGERKSDGIYVNPKSEITTAQAAVIINKIIGAKSEATMTVFADENEIPDWAKSAIVSLSKLGILSKENGKINPNSPLTRAQTAQILMSLLEYRGKISY